jgi:hypothetical protein
MARCHAAVLVLSLACPATGSGQELHAGVGYAHIFRAGGFSFASGYVHPIGRPAAVQQEIGGDFWWANTDVASQSSGNAARDVVGVGARYQIDFVRCCGRVHPVAALPLQVIHSSVTEPVHMLQAAEVMRAPRPAGSPPTEDQGGGAWGWDAGVELGLRVELSRHWSLRTSGTAMYQDVYAASTTNGAWAWHLGATYRLGS